MADIDVVPKHRTNTWLWIVLAIIVIAILIWAFARRPHTTAQLQPSSAHLSDVLLTPTLPVGA